MCKGLICEAGVDTGCFRGSRGRGVKIKGIRSATRNPPPLGSTSHVGHFCITAVLIMQKLHFSAGLLPIKTSLKICLSTILDSIGNAWIPDLCLVTNIATYWFNWKINISVNRSCGITSLYLLSRTSVAALLWNDQRNVSKLGSIHTIHPMQYFYATPFDDGHILAQVSCDVHTALCYATF